MQTVVGSFEIPEELAKELSTLITKQGIRERLLATLVGEEKYDEVEESLIELIQRIDVIKNKITEEYVPEEFRSEDYVWNYDGYEIAGRKVVIYEV
jgi:hypothetical protein